MNISIARSNSGYSMWAAGLSRLGDMSRFPAVALSIFAALLPASAQTNHPPASRIVITPAWISTLADEMRSSHPALKAAEARTNAAVAEAGAVRVWEDPMVRLGGMFGSTMMRSEDGDILYGVEQSLPLFGKPQAARRVARSGIEVETSSLDMKFQRLRAELAGAAFRAGLAGQTVSIGEEDLKWIRSISAAAEGRYRAGQSSLTEYLRFQNETSLRNADLDADRDRLRQTHVALNRLLGRPTTNGFPDLDLPGPAPEITFSEKLLEFARRYEPQTQVLQQEIQRGGKSVDLAKKSKYPEIKAGVEARNYSGNGEFRQGMVFMSMSLPWLNSGSYNKEIVREREKLRGLEFDLADYQRGIEEEIHSLAVAANAALRRALSYRDEVLPRSQSALESAQSAWEAGKGTYTELLDARRALLDARLQYARSIAEQYETLSELVLRCGLGDLGALDMLKPAAPR